MFWCWVRLNLCKGLLTIACIYYYHKKQNKSTKSSKQQFSFAVFFRTARFHIVTIVFVIKKKRLHNNWDVFENLNKSSWMFDFRNTFQKYDNQLSFFIYIFYKAHSYYRCKFCSIRIMHEIVIMYALEALICLECDRQSVRWNKLPLYRMI
jgi:hypothetical protein